MFALVSPEKFQWPVGSVVRLPATWQDYQSLYDRARETAQFRVGSIATEKRDRPLCRNCLATQQQPYYPRFETTTS